MRIGESSAPLRTRRTSSDERVDGHRHPAADEERGGDRAGDGEGGDRRRTARSGECERCRDGGPRHRPRAGGGVASAPSRARRPSNCVFAVPFATASAASWVLPARRRAITASAPSRRQAAPACCTCWRRSCSALVSSEARSCRVERRGPGAAVHVGLQERRLPGERIPAFAGLLVGVGGSEARDPFQGDRQRPLAFLGVVPLPDHDRRHRAEDHHPGHDGDEEQQQPPPEQHRSTGSGGPDFFLRTGLVPSVAGHVQRCRPLPARTTQAPVPAEPASSRQDPVRSWRPLRDVEAGLAGVGVERVLVDHRGDDRLRQLIGRHRRRCQWPRSPRPRGPRAPPRTTA